MILREKKSSLFRCTRKIGCIKKNKDETLLDEVEHQHNNAKHNEVD